ncbi:MAG: transposase [bacterium]
MDPRQNRYSPEFKAEVVLESLQRDTTLEEVRKRYGLSHSAINQWRKVFSKEAASIFKYQGGKVRYGPMAEKHAQETVEELKKIIGDLTVRLEILKKTNILASLR